MAIVTNEGLTERWSRSVPSRVTGDSDRRLNAFSGILFGMALGFAAWTAIGFGLWVALG